MKNFKGFAVAVLLHITLAAILYAATTNPEYTAPPQDILLKSAVFEGNTFAIYKSGAECVIGGKYYKLEGDGYENIPFFTECIESPTGNFIQIGDGWARCRIEGKEHIFTTP